MNTEQAIQAAARAAHEANRAWCLANGDDSQVPWDEAADWVHASAIVGVRAILANPDTTPEQQHELWCEHKQADGWRCGPVKDARAKTHPCLVPYDALPPMQRAKDAIFGSVVRSVLIAARVLGKPPAETPRERAFEHFITAVADGRDPHWSVVANEVLRKHPVPR